MPENKNTQKRNVEFKEYSANQSVNVRNDQPQRTSEELSYNASKSADVRKGYNPQMSTQQRNDNPIKEGYNAQQMVQTANSQPSQNAQQSKSDKNPDDKK